MSLGEAVIYCGLKGLFLCGNVLCSLCESSGFVRRLFLTWVPALPFIDGYWPLHWGVVLEPCWMLSGACSLICGWHSPGGGRVCSPAVAVDSPELFLSCRVRQMGPELSLWEKETLGFPP